MNPINEQFTKKKKVHKEMVGAAKYHHSLSSSLPR